MELFDLTQQQLTLFGAYLVGAVIAITVIVWLIRRIKYSSPDRRIEKIIKVESQEYAKNIILSDGMYDFLFVDYLVLMKGNIVAVDIHHLEGYIFGGDQIEQWAQVINGKSNKFKNPLYRVRLVQQQIKQLVKDADIEARVIFGADSSFPKGVPDGVLRFETLREDLNMLDKNDYLAESMSKTWEEIMKIAKQHKQRYLQESKSIKVK
jgi:hypothetical protein